MRLSPVTIAASLSPSLKAFKPTREELDRFREKLAHYLHRVVGNHSNESEEHLKTHLMDLFKGIYGSSHYVEQQERIDFVIRSGGAHTPACVLFEHKRASNRGAMITLENCNRRALHELVLYFMRERSAGNTLIKHLVVCTEFDFFIFDAKAFDRLFYKN
jgi:adenine-specific DNA-methyltransferase